MIPIAALLNTDHEEKKDSEVEVKIEPVRALFHHDMDDDHTHSPEDDDEVYGNQDKDDRLTRGSPTTTEASSLLGALTLQKLRYAPPGETDTAMTPTSAPSSRAYLSIANLTNPLDDGDNQQNDNAKPPTPGQEARAARRRSTRALFPGATDDDRRAKQRMIVKRCYYKKINTINELRDQVQQLEGVLQTVLEDQESQRDEQSEGDNQQASRLDDYVEVVKDKEVLRHENQRLRKLADEYYMKNQGRLRLLLDANRKDMVLFTAAIADE